MSERYHRDEAHALYGVWSADRGLEPPPACVFPPDAFVAFVDGFPAAMIWLARVEGAACAYAEWMITRPGLPLRAARTALLECLADIERHCQDTGIRILFACTPHNAVARCAERAGFTNDGASIHLYKPCSQ